MKNRKWYVLTFLSITLISAVLTILSIFVSEIVFYTQNNYWYFKPVKSASSVKERNDFSLYREPFSITRQKNRIRIVTIGGSTTYGLGVDSRATWPKQLSAQLNKRFPNQYEVINLGRLGGHLEEFMQNYAQSSTVYIPRDKWISGERPGKADFAPWGWKDLDPDVVVLVPIVNDTALDYLYLAEPTIVSKAARWILDSSNHSFIVNRLALGFYIKKALTVLEMRNREQIKDTVKIDKIQREYKKNLVKFIGLWDNHVRIYLVGLPLLFNDNDSEKQARQAADVWSIADTSSLLHEVKYMPRLEALERSVRSEVARELNIPYRELGENIKRMKFPQRLRLYEDSAHMNVTGVKLIADEMSDFIVKNY